MASGYSADRETILKLLNESPATEFVCVLRDLGHQLMAKGIQLKSIADEFRVHSIEEQGHADQPAERLAIDSSQNISQYLDSKDTTTRRMRESVLAVEEEHAGELDDIRQGVAAGSMPKPLAAIKSL